MTDARIAHLAKRIHALGERPLYEMLRELDAGSEVEAVVERYAQLAPLGEFIRQLDGDRLQPAARVVGGRQ